MKDIPSDPKRLIICCDGTWQSSVSGKRNIPSNVTRLARTIAKAGIDVDDPNKSWQQIVYYDSGVGTGSLTSFEQARQGGTGDGLVVNVLEAYNFLVNNYAPGDQIFCIGFSRGAFTARAIAGLVTDIGIFKPDNMQSFAPLWAAYQRNTAKHDFRKSKEYFQYMNGVRPMVEKGKENEKYILKPWELPHIGENDREPLTHKNSNVVEVVGVFDTVGGLGMADTYFRDHAASRQQFDYLNVGLSPFIKHAFHALALDERREPFLPTLWYIPNKETLDKEEAKIDKEYDDWPELKDHRNAIDQQIRDHQTKYPTDLYQVWFPGVHINIGGGSDQDGADAQGLSNLTYAWMIQQLGPYLAFEKWTWDGIKEYQYRVMQEQDLYASMKNDMPLEEQKQYASLMKKSKVENAKDYVAEWGHWIWESGRSALGYEGAQLVPVPPQNIEQPKIDERRDTKGNLIQVRWALAEVVDSYTAMYKAISGPKNRTPGECIDRSREHGEPLKKLGRTNEYIHPAVWRRYQAMKDEKGQPKYVSKALLGFRRVQEKKYGSWGYWKEETGVWIPEWFIKPFNRFLQSAGLPEGMDTQGDEPWQHAEWEYTNRVTDRDDIQKDIARFYCDAQAAKKKMEAEKKEFPFDLPLPPLL